MIGGDVHARDSRLEVFLRCLLRGSHEDPNVNHVQVTCGICINPALGLCFLLAMDIDYFQLAFLRWQRDHRVSRNYSELTQIERSEIMLRAQDLKISAKRGPLTIEEVLQESRQHGQKPVSSVSPSQLPLPLVCKKK